MKSAICMIQSNSGIATRAHNTNSQLDRIRAIIKIKEKDVKSKILICSFMILTVAYICLVLFLPTDPTVLARYNLSTSDARLINLSVSIPLVAIWATAFFGFTRFKTYAQKVKASAEGDSYNQLADGLMILAFSLPINSLLSNLSNYLAIHHKNTLPTTTILRSYITLGFSIIVFLMLSRGAKNLAATIKSTSRARLLLVRYNDILLIILSSVFSWLIISRSLSQANGKVIYYLSDWQIILTLAIPYLFAWHQGVLAASRIYLYKKKVKGKIYKSAFDGLAKGIGVVVLVSVLIQLITMVSVRLTRLHLTPILLIIYLLLILYAIGFGMVARGAAKLKKIEEV